MSLPVTGGNAVLNGLVAAGRWISLHIGDPGTTGAHEIVGGTYVRLQVTWPTASTGTLIWVGTLNFAIPSATTVTYWGFWSAATGGSFITGGLLAAPRTFVAAGTCPVTQLTLVA